MSFFDVSPMGGRSLGGVGLGGAGRRKLGMTHKKATLGGLFEGGLFEGGEHSMEGDFQMMPHYGMGGVGMGGASNKRSVRSMFGGALDAAARKKGVEAKKKIQARANELQHSGDPLFKNRKVAVARARAEHKASKPKKARTRAPAKPRAKSIRTRPEADKLRLETRHKNERKRLDMLKALKGETLNFHIDTDRNVDDKEYARALEHFVYWINKHFKEIKATRNKKHEPQGGAALPILHAVHQLHQMTGGGLFDMIGSLLGL